MQDERFVSWTNCTFDSVINRFCKFVDALKFVNKRLKLQIRAESTSQSLIQQAGQRTFDVAQQDWVRRNEMYFQNQEPLPTTRLPLYTLHTSYGEMVKEAAPPITTENPNFELARSVEVEEYEEEPEADDEE